MRPSCASGPWRCVGSRHSGGPAGGGALEGGGRKVGGGPLLQRVEGTEANEDELMK